MVTKSLLTSAVALVLASLASAHTWIVDDDGGVGVDFTEVQPAIDVAAPGDAILVRAGSYSPFTIYRGVAVIGESGVLVNGTVSFSLLPAGQRAALVEFACVNVEIDHCGGRVVLENVQSTGRLYVGFSPDVRARAVQFQPAQYADAIATEQARLELVLADARGTDGLVGLAGAAGLYANSSSRVHVVASTLRAGDGGWSPVPFQIAPDGGPGGFAESSALLLATGGTAFFGGAGGANPAQPTTCAYDGFGGYGVGGLGTLYATGITAQGGAYDQSLHCAGTLYAPAFDSALTQVTSSVAEPTLSVSGPTFGGTTVVLTITGEPGASGTLYLGRKLLVGSAGSAVIEQLVSHERALPIAAFPPSGIVTKNVFLPAWLGVGFVFGAQAEVISSIGLQRTNSLPFVVR